MLPTLLPLGLVLLSLQPVPAQAGVLHNVHSFAKRHTKQFARDLRVAFGGMVLPRDASEAQHVLYCKVSSGSSLTSDGDDSDSGTSPSSSGHHSGSTTKTGTASSASATATSSYNSPWKLKTEKSGDSFFDGWDFWSTTDPTHGTVTYVDEDTARKNNLISVNDDGNVIMRVDTTEQVCDGRMSVRIHSQDVFTGGLLILDAVHLPTGCGSWPAFWTNGPNWPTGGEIDIVEYVHDYTNDQATVHTAPGCNLPTDSTKELNITGSIVGGTNCAAAETGNQGCGVRSPDKHSAGAAFNSIGGGVYTMVWDDDGIAIYFFRRDSIPDDITAGEPRPDLWGTAAARWPASSCDPYKYFYDNIAIFDTTFCGDWAGSAWTTSGILGQDTSCADRTGVSTCEEYVLNHGSSFQETYWEIKSYKLYQQSK
ncbi:hypothetical protein K525DRAFT_258590 [Schizophyllum commune Loenen D]|nr:hypothetical protein K525DRAFT_258590 [Schizophyllum commune Loenen D]